MDFNTGVALPEVDLDQLSENDNVVREEANYYPVLTAACNIDRDGLENFSSALLIDEVVKASTASGTTFQLADLSTSGLTVGLHEIVFRVYSEDEDSGAANTQSFSFPFYKSPEMNFLTIWAKHHGSITVLGHRLAKAWA